MEPSNDKPSNHAMWMDSIRRHGGRVLVRTVGAGVHFGVIEDSNAEGTRVILNNARRLWSWGSTPEDPQPKYTLSEVAMRGPAPEHSNVSEELPWIILSTVIEVMPISEQGWAVLRECRWSGR